MTPEMWATTWNMIKSLGVVLAIIGTGAGLFVTAFLLWCGKDSGDAE